MYNPVGTFIGKCMAEDGEVENCDFKLVLEDNGFTKEVSIAFLVAQCFGFIVNLMGYIGLHKCNPCLLFVLVLVLVISIIWNLVTLIMANEYSISGALLSHWHWLPFSRGFGTRHDIISGRSWNREGLRKMNHCKLCNLDIEGKREWMKISKM